jgi:hypothetical protein
MTLFIDLRATSSGGICAKEATLWEDGVKPVAINGFVERIRGRDLVLATHGFNVSRNEGVKSLSCWAQVCQLPQSSVFVGVLWPGDSRFFPVIDYPFEGDEAIASGRLLADFLNREAVAAASLSFVSHSLGARTILEAVANLDGKVRRLILMAGAIENNCLTKEYQSAANKAEEIYTLASKKDRVLQWAFPIGNPIGEIVMHGHPYFKVALGRAGPDRPIPLEQRGGAWQIPDSWKYGHGDYLPDNAVAKTIALPVEAPGPQTSIPANPQFPEWESAWSASAVSTQVS